MSWRLEIRPEVETDLAALKAALTGNDAADMKAKTEALAKSSMKLGEAVYKDQQGASGPDAGPGPGPGGAAGAGAGASGPAGGDSKVVDADFEEVDEKKRNKA